MIPIILGIAIVSPFDEPMMEKPEEIENTSDFGMIYFFLMLLWFFFLFRILFQLKKGTFNIQKKY
ncbi:MAG: hypothetical protein ACE5RF_05870 [Nitrosarchaeum sp.]